MSAAVMKKVETTHTLTVGVWTLKVYDNGEAHLFVGSSSEPRLYLRADDVTELHALLAEAVEAMDL
jgi:hypothetical protein